MLWILRKRCICNWIWCKKLSGLFQNYVHTKTYFASWIRKSQRQRTSKNFWRLKLNNKCIFCTEARAWFCTKLIKVHIFWEGHKILQNLRQLFDWQYIFILNATKIMHSINSTIGGDFAKFCGLLRIQGPSLQSV